MPLTDEEKSKYGVDAFRAILAKGEAKDVTDYQECMGLTDHALKKVINRLSIINVRKKLSNE